MENSWYNRAKQFQRDLFDKQLFVFAPHISFRGEIFDADGSDRLSDGLLNLLKWGVEPVEAQA